ncbi:WD40-repeat protein (notchless protein), related protein, putative [Rhizoctonia solani AG-3 Rhs1AP]|uniref:WD40-repeat protein (Notchless protein), related protein, putative n=1 Tax=Rhizoctonia solani AG-3 Rhs1AP TaxID=1086054 RepID=X8JB25_9AGAM|nr:WD40-repeat protein (notchless protein), related protein, putative [Rhizoctonia solani AG-3 Rhs1AP]
MVDVPTSPQRSRHPLSFKPPSTPARRHGQASTNTPFRASSALSISASTAKSNPSYVDTSRQSASATPAPATQIQMDKFIESELHNAIFHDPKFIDRFLSGDVAKLDRVHEKCRNLDDYYDKNGRWKLPSTIRTEKSLYAPILDILNTIKAAVDTVNPATHAGPVPRDRDPAILDNSNPLTSDDDPSGDFIPEQPQFSNTSTYTIRSDRSETELIKPDFVLFEDVDDKHKHWEHARMPIEIKKLAGYHKAAMKQLSRYARAVFAHQLHRRHLYAMMVCNTEATFVRFDRAGILYSHRINLRTDSKAFTYAFASLMLDRIDQGYDPAFTCEINQDGRLDYYVDLPASAFTAKNPSTDSAPSEETETYRFMVVDRLCHRRSICGRATIVLRIRKVEEGDDGDEYILKIMWRDPERGAEGDVLRKVKGKFGVAQYVWHGDAFGKCRCSLKANGKWECTKCVAETAKIGEMEVCDQLTDIAIEVPPEDGKDPELKLVDTSVCHPISQRRPYRICVFLVMSSKGVPLEKAESPQQFMQAVLDAILGYRGLFNVGILHRDISEGNVLMLSPGQNLDRDDILSNTEIIDDVLIESEKKLREVLDQLGDREPAGMLSDLDLYSTHSLVPPEAPPIDSPKTSTSASGGAVLATPSSPVRLSPPSSRASGLVRSREEEEDTTETERGSKKRKTLTCPEGVPGTTRVGPIRSHASSRDHEGNRLIDFRTGTPAFMSIRVVKVSVGEKYHHSFLDDIESFFWLILWSTAAHLDPAAERPTAAAQSMLNLLNQEDPYGMRSFIFPSYQVNEVNEGNGETSSEHPELIWKVTIKSLTPAVVYYSRAPIRFSRIEGTCDGHRPNETVKFLLKAPLQFASIVAEALPEATFAKITFLLLIKVWELLEQNAQCDGTIEEILRGLSSIQGVVGVLSQASKSILASTMGLLKEPISGILRLLEDISVHMFNRLVAHGSDISMHIDKAYLDDTFNIPEYLVTLENLQSAFHASWSTLAAPRMDSTNVIYDEPPTWQKVSASADDPLGKMEGKFQLHPHRARTAETSFVIDPYEMLNLLGPMDIGGYDPDQACMHGTRQAILNKIITWTQNRDNAEAFMWISGQAGMGKTAIATSLCQRLDTMQALAGSFFFRHDDPDRNSPITLINNIIHDTAMQCPAYAHEVASAIRTNRKLCKAHFSLRYEGLVQKPLERLRSLSTPTMLVLVIDGLDECGDRDSRTRILQKLYDMSKLVPWLKIIITARPVGDIQQYFQDHFPHNTIAHLHDFNASSDIRAYLEDQLGELAQMERWPLDNISKLCVMAQGVFLWATATTKYIRSSTIPASSRIERILDNQKTPVVDCFDALYTRALDKAIDGNDDETKDAYIRCIGAIIATSEREPLAVPDLQYLLFVAGRIDQLTVGRAIRNLGPLLLVLDGQCARFHHSSFKEYITNASRSGDFFIELDQYEAEPATCCLKVMQRDLRFNICKLDTSHILNSEVLDLKLRIDTHIGPALKYACIHWIDHFIASPKQALVAEIRKLFEGPQLMYWVEVLSILGCLDLVVTGLSALASATLPQQFDDWSLIVFWVKDLRRFILSFYDIITASTPHLYVSALAFSPTTSPIVQRMRPYFPNTIKVAKGGNLTWHPCIRSILHPDAILSLSLSLNGLRVATGYPDGSVCIWDTQTGVRVYKPLTGHSTPVTCVALSSNGEFVASSSYDTTVRVWDLSGSVPAGHILTGHSGSVHAISFSPSATIIASTSSDQTIRLWDNKAMKPVGYLYAGHSSRISCLAFSHDGIKLVSGSWDKTVRVWSVDSGDFRSTMNPLLIVRCSESITCVAFSPDGSKIASGSVDGAIQTWDSHDGNEVQAHISLPKHSNSITSIAFSLNGKLIVTSSLDGVIQIWDATTLVALSQPFGHSNCVNGVAFTPDSACVVSGSADMTVRLWDITACPKSIVTTPFVGHSDSVYSIACSSDGTRIISGSKDKSVRLWDAQNGTPIGDPLVGYTKSLNCVAFSPDGTRVVSGSDDNTIKLWDTKAHALIHSYQHSSVIRCIRFSADGALIVFGAADCKIYLCESPEWRIMGDLQGHSKLVLSIAFSPDGLLLASASGDSTVILWDLKSRSALGERLSGHTDWVRSVAFSPCGTQIASGSEDQTVRVWDVRTGSIIHTLQGHSGPVTTVAFSPNGSHIASGSYDRTIQLWNAKTGHTVGEPLIGHSHRVWSLAFSPCGNYIISGSTDGTIRVWIPDIPNSVTELANDLTYCWPSNPYDLSLHPHYPGWVTDDQQSHIFWLPMHYRQPAYFLRTHSWVPAPQIFLDYSRFVHGTGWIRAICD